MVRVGGFAGQGSEDGAGTVVIDCFPTLARGGACGVVNPDPLVKGSDDKCGATPAGAACGQHSDCPGSFCQLKNRFITGVVPVTATAHGIKVTLVTLDANSVATPGNYTTPVGTTKTERWAGTPTVNVSDGTSPQFNAAKLQCAFAPFDWNALLTGSTGGMTLHMYGDVVVPASLYDVSSCSPQANCSAALRIGTAKFGDIVLPLNVTNFQDITAVVNKFGGIQLPPAAPSKTRTKLSEPVNPSTLVNFQDISGNVSAFQTTPYRIKYPAVPVVCP
jgi:hypothetical protein